MGGRRICFNVIHTLLTGRDMVFLSGENLYKTLQFIKKIFITFLVQAQKTDKQAKKQTFEFGWLFCRILPFKLTKFVFNSDSFSVIMRKINITQQ